MFAADSKKLKDQKDFKILQLEMNEKAASYLIATIYEEIVQEFQLSFDSKQGKERAERLKITNVLEGIQLLGNLCKKIITHNKKLCKQIQNATFENEQKWMEEKMSFQETIDGLRFENEQLKRNINYSLERKLLDHSLQEVITPFASDSNIEQKKIETKKSTEEEDIITSFNPSKTETSHSPKLQNHENYRLGKSKSASKRSLLRNERDNALDLIKSPKEENNNDRRQLHNGSTVLTRHGFFPRRKVEKFLYKLLKNEETVRRDSWKHIHDEILARGFPSVVPFFVDEGRATNILDSLTIEENEELIGRKIAEL